MFHHHRHRYCILTAHFRQFVEEARDLPVDWAGQEEAPELPVDLDCDDVKEGAAHRDEDLPGEEEGAAHRDEDLAPDVYVDLAGEEVQDALAAPGDVADGVEAPARMYHYSAHC